MVGSASTQFCEQVNKKIAGEDNSDVACMKTRTSYQEIFQVTAA